MGEVCYGISLAVVDAHQQLNAGVDEHKYTGFDGYRWEDEIEAYVGGTCIRMQGGMPNIAPDAPIVGVW